jgi:hypothetical protein
VRCCETSAHQRQGAFHRVNPIAAVAWYSRSVAYRDDREADQERIQALEGELAIAKNRIAELEGRREQALVLATRLEESSAAQRWLGAPTHLELERTFEGTFPVDKFEELVEHIREITRDRGRTELLKTSVAWWASSAENVRGTGPFTCVTVTVKDGKTIVRVTDRLGQLAGALFGGVGGGLAGGGLVAPIFVTIAMPILAPLVFGAWFGGSYTLARALYKHSAKKRAQKLQQVFAAVEGALARELSSVEKSPVELANEESSKRLPGERARLSEKTT